MKQPLFVIQFIAFSLVLAASDLRLPLQGLNYDLEEYNKTDNAGRKTGIWLYESMDTVIVSYYTTGVKNGIENRYIKLNDSYYLEYHKVYINGNLIMPSIAYYNNGLVKYEITERHEIDQTQPTVIVDSNHTSSQCLCKNIPNISIQLSDLTVDTDSINQLDNKGHKTGVWIIEHSDIVEVAYYKDGLKNGLWRQFMKKDGIYRLNYEANYLNGHSYGFKIAYDKDGYVAWIETNMSENTDFIDSQTKFFKGYHPDFISDQAFYNYYYPDGTLKAYGWTLKADDDSEQIDEDFVGNWHFFTETGDSIILNEDQIRTQGLPVNLF
ncbi:MAG: hypothetical protein K2N28_00405 [Muribaculaceae bacterium]|nr:hypothetical protein [Muribaculaceae bacterium]